MIQTQQRSEEGTQTQQLTGLYKPDVRQFLAAENALEANLSFLSRININNAKLLELRTRQ